MSSRIDNFKGTHDAYLQYLEEQVSSLRQRLGEQESRASPSSGGETQRPATPLQDSRQYASSPSAPLQQRRGIQFKHWKPDLPSTRKPPSKTPLWKSRANELVRRVPSASEWHQVVEEQGIADAMQSGAAVTYLLKNEHIQGSTTSYSCSLGDSGSPLDIFLERILEYAQVAAERQRTASLAKMMANFQRFVVISACVVLDAEQHIPKSRVYEIVRCCVGDVTEVYCTRMLRTASKPTPSAPAKMVATPDVECKDQANVPTGLCTAMMFCFERALWSQFSA
ncbi:hypothetical protein CERZMDRAFT_84833 [Cercospora zeae-maydis SCOH1-5]|uniref:Uncharacterized protein n=1 Tax=Cercospora zeae-maydis SCOH1-5 TaxID=717836 RepID=A0A6A6FGG3_9PEZI|nr:hypothetical protein CERZMDRAFT_84833 [Cercospora zeae-maydis SCOH1-5]